MTDRRRARYRPGRPASERFAPTETTSFAGNATVQGRGRRHLLWNALKGVVGAWTEEGPDR